MSYNVVWLYWITYVHGTQYTVQFPIFEINMLKALLAMYSVDSNVERPPQINKSQK